MTEETWAGWAAIAAPLDPKQIKVRKQGNANIRYISREDVIYRLNQVCPGEWNFRTEPITTPQGAAGQWVVKGILTIRGVTREDFGMPANDEHFDPPKAAVSDALKRCASQFGFALELYGDEPQAPALGDEPVKPASAPQDAPQSELDKHLGPRITIPHWVDNLTTRKRFWKYTKDTLGLNIEQVYMALGVEKIHDYKGTMEEAKDRLDVYADSQGTKQAVA